MPLLPVLGGQLGKSPRYFLCCALLRCAVLWLCSAAICSALLWYHGLLCCVVASQTMSFTGCSAQNCAVLGTLCPTFFATEGQLARSHQCAQYIVTSLTEVIKLLRPCQLLLYVLSSLPYSLQAQTHGASAQHSAPALAYCTPCIYTVCEQSQLL